MPYYQYVDNNGKRKLIKLPEEEGDQAATDLLEAYSQAIVFWSEEELTKQETSSAPAANAQGVWLSFEQGSSYEGMDVIGISSTETLARQVCQTHEDQWGSDAISPLDWGENYPDQADGYVKIYYVSKRVVDEEK